jgi:predicted GNAT family acetyltransferase
VKLRTISAKAYARDVLPLTAALWAGRRSFEQYVAQTLELAASAYGRRSYRTVGLFDGRRLVASFKRFGRELRDESRRLNAIGFGAVFTPDELRGRGYASFMLASALDAARRDGYDVAYLFSDIRPHFYAALGFRELPSRRLGLHADALPSARLQVVSLDRADSAAVRRCFDRTELRRDAAFVRDEAMWRWIATRVGHGSEHSTGYATNFAVRRGRSIRAYVLGARVPERDAYVFDEFGFSDDAGAEIVPALLRAAAGDLRRVVGWLPPAGARQTLPKGTTHKRKGALLMMAPLCGDGERLIAALSRNSSADFTWATDHI